MKHAAVSKVADVTGAFFQPQMTAEALYPHH